MKIRLVLFVLLAMVTCAAQSQPQPKSITEVVGQNKVKGQQYENSYFGLVLKAPDAKIQAPSFVNAAGKRARLVDVLSNSADLKAKYTLSLLADSLENYPQLSSTTQYVRSVRHQMEREGLQTVKEEFPITISGVPFTGAVLKLAAPEGTHYRGMYTASLNGYLVSLDITASSQEQLQKIINELILFNR